AKGGLTMRNRITAFALMTQIVVPALPIIRVVAYAQQSSDKPAISLSTVSKLDRSQAGIYRTKIGKIDVIAVSDGTVGLGHGNYIDLSDLCSVNARLTTIKLR